MASYFRSLLPNQISQYQSQQHQHQFNNRTLFQDDDALHQLSSSTFTTKSMVVNPQANQLSVTIQIFIGIICLMMMLATICGNFLVIFAVAIVKKLRIPSNYLIVSLAISDLFVGVIVMPLTTYHELNNRQWNLGALLCDIWISGDVLLCTASILNLVVISVDRYFVITKPFRYVAKRTPKLMLGMILGVWFLSACVISPPLLVWHGKPSKFLPKYCGYSTHLTYQLCAIAFSFYVPLIILIIVYVKIFMAAKNIYLSEANSSGVEIEPVKRKFTTKCLDILHTCCRYCCCCLLTNHNDDDDNNRGKLSNDNQEISNDNNLVVFNQSNDNMSQNRDMMIDDSQKDNNSMMIQENRLSNNDDGNPNPNMEIKNYLAIDPSNSLISVGSNDEVSTTREKDENKAVFRLSNLNDSMRDRNKINLPPMSSIETNSITSSIAACPECAMHVLASHSACATLLDATGSAYLIVNPIEKTIHEASLEKKKLKDSFYSKSFDNNHLQIPNSASTEENLQRMKRTNRRCTIYRLLNSSPRLTSVVFNPMKKKSFVAFMARRRTINNTQSHSSHKATITLGVIMGCFILCWLPFFICQLVRYIYFDIYKRDPIPRLLDAIFLWLGYSNSFFNPIIYARFNRDFRTPFKEILCCRCRKINTTIRSKFYETQYGINDDIRPSTAGHF
ncbi:hypothetical protein SNEBB_005515 [Seison nebaliae]|nr:hypothetical protein SNEBB_005515 [Seison nebaliae]